MSLNSIVMSYKENCKAEGEIMTKFKIAKMYFTDKIEQLEIAKHLSCHKNTINNIILVCRNKSPDDEIWEYLNSSVSHISAEKLESLFSFFKHSSRKPKNHKLSIKSGSEDEMLIIDKFGDKKYGVRRMFHHLKREGVDIENRFTIGKIKGVYKRLGFRSKRIRTANGERRALYDYDLIGAFEYLQYDVKVIADQHALPVDIYAKFKHSKKYPKYQWTIIDAKTRTRFLAYSYTISSFFGLSFLKYTLNWIRSHGIFTKINIQVDRGGEFYSGSKRKQITWNEELKIYNAYVYDTEGAKYKQNLVERSHRTDDEEFYCPRGNKINTKSEFMTEAQFWIIYYNTRSHTGVKMNGLSPLEKLEKIGIINAKKIINFPCIILDDLFYQFQTFFDINIGEKNFSEKSQNVLTDYKFSKFLNNYSSIFFCFTN